MSKILSTLISYAMLLGILGLIVVLLVFSHYGKSVDDYRKLAAYEPPLTSRLYAADGRLLAEYASEKRAFVPYEAVPKRLVEAFISAEDKKFFSHGGIDFVGIIRAILQNVKNIGSGRRMIGASTITQQVAKNFLLTNEATFERKIKEAILAIRIERAFSKEYIMELYLNQIFLGHRSYGVAAAALNYFNKSLDELSIAESAFLAALPKGPSNYNPETRYKQAIGRRNWVISRMHDEGYISTEQANLAVEEPIILAKRPENETAVDAEYFSEEVRRLLVSRYGEDALYEGGLAVRTTADPQMQKLATKALRKGLMTYDQRHGFRKPLAKIPPEKLVEPEKIESLEETLLESAVVKEPQENVLESVEQEEKEPELLAWQKELQALKFYHFSEDTWQKAVVLETSDDNLLIGLESGQKGEIPLAELKWARKTLPDQKLGPEIKKASAVLEIGDVIWVEEKKTKQTKKSNKEEEKEEPLATFALRQEPDVEGAMIALDPHTGRVLALVGGYDFQRSQFNRAVQGQRQPGSSFKPFIYLAALDEGFTPSSLVLDAPFVMDQGHGLGKWKPQNYARHFYGPTTLRVGLEKSRNLITVRLAKAIGIEKVTEYARKFGISDTMPNHMSVSLGSGETSALKLAAAYGMLVNGGKKIEPIFIDRIQDRAGNTVYNSDTRPCENCQTKEGWQGQLAPSIPDIREEIEDPRSAYQIINILTGVLAPGGSAASLRSLGKTYAGKTGTSNDSFDGWFVGITPDLIVAITIGFDIPRTLGPRDTGGVVAAPIFKDFAETALKDMPLIPFRVPAGLRFARVNHQTGRPAKRNDRDVVMEAFKAEENWQGKIKGFIDGSDESTGYTTPDSQSSGGLKQTEQTNDYIPEVGSIF